MRESRHCLQCYVRASAVAFPYHIAVHPLLQCWPWGHTRGLVYACPTCKVLYVCKHDPPVPWDRYVISRNFAMGLPRFRGSFAEVSPVSPVSPGLAGSPGSRTLHTSVCHGVCAIFARSRPKGKITRLRYRVRPDLPLVGAALAHSGSNVTVVCTRGSTSAQNATGWSPRTYQDST